MLTMYMYRLTQCSGVIIAHVISADAHIHTNVADQTRKMLIGPAKGAAGW